jgi:hypothetical protein
MLHPHMPLCVIHALKEFPTIRSLIVLATFHSAIVPFRNCMTDIRVTLKVCFRREAGRAEGIWALKGLCVGEDMVAGNSQWVCEAWE